MAEAEWYPMKWFGTRWDSWLNKINPEVKVPVGHACHRCGKPIGEGDSGVVTGKAEAIWHLNCFGEQLDEDTEKREEAARAEAQKKQREQEAKAEHQP